jgi:hypothetical protein
MLVDFQQALADLVADPALCLRLRRDPQAVRGRYVLTDQEWSRLRGMAEHDGMSAACTVYRMNRLSPLAMNLHDTLHALGPALGPTLADYWRAHPRGIPHFQLESRRFCDFLRMRAAEGHAVSVPVQAALALEAKGVDEALAASMGGVTTAGREGRRSTLTR